MNRYCKFDSELEKDGREPVSLFFIRLRWTRLLSRLMDEGTTPAETNREERVQ